MASLGMKIALERQKRLMTQPQLAVAVGYSVSVIQKLEGDATGKGAPGIRARKTVCDYLGIHYDAAKEVEARAAHNVGKRVMLDTPPQWDCNVAAGDWVDCPTAFALDTRNDEWRAILRQGLFRVRIAGDSMESVWHDGEIVEFKRMVLDENGFVKGEDYYIHRSDGMATFKRFHGADDDSYIFIAINRKKYKKEIIVPRQEIALAGIAMGTFTPKRRNGHLALAD